MKPCKIRINNPEHSRAVQEHLFDQGYSWTVYGKTFKDWLRMWEGGCFLYTNAGGSLYWDRECHWGNYKIEEIGLQHLDPHLNQPKEPNMTENTLTRLHKAQEDLLQAEENYTNASEALNIAEKAHTEALEAFRKEAVGLLGESFKTPSASSQEDMDNPLNWEVGDVVVLVSDDMRWTPDLMGQDNICFGDHVEVSVSPYSDKTGRLWFNLKESGLNLHPQDFKWHSRPSKR